LERPLTAHAPRTFTLGEPGDVVRWRRLNGLLLAEVEYEAGQRIHRHVHAYARFVLILSGSLTEIRRDEEAMTYGPSTLLFRRAGEPHSYQVHDDGARCLIVDLDPAWIGRARAQAPVLVSSAWFRRGLLLHLAHRLYGEFRLRDDVSRLAIESLALGVLAEASRRARAGAERLAPHWLSVAMAIVEQQFAERLLLTTVAQRAGVHPVHLARTFRRVYRTTFASYVRQVRVDFARRQLAGPTALSEIAGAAGFCDQSHFSRCFKRYTGLTPAEYRARLG
jgi:AraC family transcriptional regulator